jgi:aconitate hydratase
VIHRPDREEDRVALTLRLDTPAEVNYVRHGGIMPYMLDELVA